MKAIAALMGMLGVLTLGYGAYSALSKAVLESQDYMLLGAALLAIGSMLINWNASIVKSMATPEQVP